VEIRRREIGQFKSRLREELLQAKYIEEMLEQLPASSHESSYWAEDLFRLYSQAAHFTLSPAQALELFWIVEKFPSRVSMHLLEAVILKADQQSLDQIFQYDIMKLLHTTIALNDQISYAPPIPCGQGDTSQEAVVCSRTA
jgi:hypothetical protein